MFKVQCLYLKCKLTRHFDKYPNVKPQFVSKSMTNMQKQISCLGFRISIYTCATIITILLAFFLFKNEDLINCTHTENPVLTNGNKSLRNVLKKTYGNWRCFFFIHQLVRGQPSEHCHHVI